MRLDGSEVVTQKVEEVPCGVSITTEYRDKDSGELKRRDVHIEVRSLPVGSESGHVN